MLEKKEKRIRRHKRVRAKILGTKERPRLCVFRSNAHIYAQMINDEKGKVLFQASDISLKSQVLTKTIKSEKKDGGDKIKMGRKGSAAYEIGKLIAEMAAKEKIEKIVFDRGGFKYHGVVKALADGAREGGLKF